MRDDFLAATKNNLAKRVGYKCSNPDCRKPTIGPNNDKNKSTSIGVAAHISAASQGGARFDHNLTSNERIDIDNGIWLCNNCSVLIDKDFKKYSIDILRNWKDLAEKEAFELISRTVTENTEAECGIPEISFDSLFNLNDTIDELVIFLNACEYNIRNIISPICQITFLFEKALKH